MKPIVSCFLLCTFCTHFTLAQSPMPTSDPAAVKAITLAAQRAGLAAKFPPDLLASGSALVLSGVSVSLMIKQKANNLIRTEIGGTNPGALIVKNQQASAIDAKGTGFCHPRLWLQCSMPSSQSYMDVLVPYVSATSKGNRAESLPRDSADLRN